MVSVLVNPTKPVKSKKTRKKCLTVDQFAAKRRGSLFYGYRNREKQLRMEENSRSNTKKHQDLLQVTGLVIIESFDKH
jgi:hypothetical protein